MHRAFYFYLAVGNGTGPPPRCLLYNDVDVGTAEAKCTYSSEAATIFRPGLPLLRDEKGCALERDALVEFLQIEVSRNLPLVQTEHDLDQACDAGCCLQVTNIGLDRAYNARLIWRAILHQHSFQRLELDGVSQRSAGAMRLNVAHLIR
jgi:hypothetical protein